MLKNYYGTVCVSKKSGHIFNVLSTIYSTLEEAEKNCEILNSYVKEDEPMIYKVRKFLTLEEEEA